MSSSTMRARLLTVLLIALTLVAIGCGGRRTHGSLDPALSRRLVAKSLVPKVSDEEAIVLLRAAVETNPYNASARNNLGVRLMAQQQYYDAAREFEEATKLAAASPEPRVNLGLLFENIGQLREAGEQYAKALVVSPHYLPAQQAAARVRVRRGQVDGETIALLRAVVMRSPDLQWRQWAQRELSKVAPGEVPATQETRPTVPEVLQDRILVPAR